MPWIPLNNRDDSTQELIASLSDQFDSPKAFEDFYNENDFGLLASEDLNHKLKSLHRSAVSSANDQQASATSSSQASENEAISSEYIAEGESYECKSLRYLRANAKRPDDRAWAELLYSRALLDLWRQYVMDTGETYYPPLAEDLIKFYEFEQENN